MPLASTVDLHALDLPGTLFPLDTNRVVIENGYTALTDYIYNQIAIDTGLQHRAEVLAL